MTDAQSYGAVLADNVKAARVRAGIKQASCARRMRHLGFDWHPQTVGNVERNERRLTAEEVLGLSGVLRTSVRTLMTVAPDVDSVVLPSGATVLAPSVIKSVLWGRNDGWVDWDEDDAPLWFREKRDPSQEEEFAEGVADLRAQGVWGPTAERTMTVAQERDAVTRERDDLARQVAELKRKLGEEESG